MSIADTVYTARFLLPELIERGRDNLIKAPIYRSGALAAPSSGTVSVYDDGSTAVVSAASVTVSGSVAQYTLSAATVASEPFGAGWRVEWALVMPDGVTHTFRNDAALIRRRLYPVVSDADLFRRHPDLDPGDSASLVASGTDYQDFLDEAWATIETKLINMGQRPWLVMSPSAFRDLHIYSTLELIMVHFATTAGDSKWQQLADTYAMKAERAWSDLNFLYDADDDGQIDDDNKRRSAVSTVWLCGRP